MPVVELLVSGGAKAGPAGPGQSPGRQNYQNFLMNAYVIVVNVYYFQVSSPNDSVTTGFQGGGQGARAQGVPTADGLPPNRSYFISR